MRGVFSEVPTRPLTLVFERLIWLKNILTSILFSVCASVFAQKAHLHTIAFYNVENLFDPHNHPKNLTMITHQRENTKAILTELKLKGFSNHFPVYLIITQELNQ